MLPSSRTCWSPSASGGRTSQIYRSLLAAVCFVGPPPLLVYWPVSWWFLHTLDAVLLDTVNLLHAEPTHVSSRGRCLSYLSKPLHLKLLLVARDRWARKIERKLDLWPPSTNNSSIEASILIICSTFTAAASIRGHFCFLNRYPERETVQD